MQDLITSNYDLLTFDCYGTLVDWEGALINYLQPVLLSHDVHVFNGTILEFFSDFEPEEQANGGLYREVLRRVIKRYGSRLGFTPSEEETIGFIECIAKAEPFSDTIEALKILKQHFQLGIISNTDSDLIQLTLPTLEVSFDEVLTAQELGEYKPKALKKAISKIKTPKERILHVAQSPFHDIKPASDLGLDTAHINRVNSEHSAVREVAISPNWTYPDLGSFAAAIETATS